MNILDRIVIDKQKEVALRKHLIPISQLEASVLFARETVSLSDNLRHSNTGIIAEHKRRSPSKAVINQSSCVDQVIKGYDTAGVCGMSVLTDAKYFGGSLDDLLLARASTEKPLLRKDFIVSEYQILEAKAYGADVILLIAAVLSPKQVSKLTLFAKSLGLEVLLEVHNEKELLDNVNAEVQLLGINNRNLKDFTVSIDTSKSLSKLIPDDFVKVSESGISSTDAIVNLQSYGYRGFLIGENFMKTNDPALSAKEFLKELSSLSVI